MSQLLREEVKWAAGVLVCAALAGCGGGPRPEEVNDALSSPAYIRSVAFLKAQSHSPDAAVRANCIEALQSARDPRAVDVIEQGLHDAEPIVRFAAAMAAGKEQARTTLPTLETMATTDESHLARVGAIYALARMGRSNNMGGLAAYLVDQDTATRANTALVLGLLGNPSAIEMLNARRDDPDIRVRFELTAALARLGDVPAQKVIVSETINQFGEDQWNAMMVCADLPEELVRSPLVSGLNDVPNLPADKAPPVEIVGLTTRRQLVAARSIAKHGDHRSGADVAVKNLKNPDPALRGLALLALGDMLTPDLVPKIAQFLNDSDDGVQRAAAAAIVQVFNRAEN